MLLQGGSKLSLSLYPQHSHKRLLADFCYRYINVFGQTSNMLVKVPLDLSIDFDLVLWIKFTVTLFEKLCIPFQGSLMPCSFVFYDSVVRKVHEAMMWHKSCLLGSSSEKDFLTRLFLGQMIVGYCSLKLGFCCKIAYYT